jgi:hypothetical protein
MVGGERGVPGNCTKSRLRYILGRCLTTFDVLYFHVYKGDISFVIFYKVSTESCWSSHCISSIRIHTRIRQLLFYDIQVIKSHMPTLRKREPSSPIRRRITRATSHISDTHLATTASTPELLEETAPSSSAESTPDRVVEEEMLHREGASRRTAKNIEDVNDIEEKGLYRTNSNSSIRSDRGNDVREKLLAERQRDERSPSVEKEGLNSKRDKEAFALLVVLCKLLFPLTGGILS